MRTLAITQNITLDGSIEMLDDWFDPSTGLLLKETRDNKLQVGSQFVGRLDYTDRSAYTLISVTPDR